MDASKKAAFVKAMGRGRAKFSKGGMIRKIGDRKYFADGGTTLAGPTDSGVVRSQSNPNTGILGTIGGALGLNNNFQAAGANIQNGTNAAQLNQSYAGAQDALTNQQNLTNTLMPQAGVGVASQNLLTNQLTDMSQGLGPNPALAQLNQATGQNVANQAALAAGQRGASGNVGLMARQAAQQGASTQQQAVGQGATMQAQQQIAAQQNLANLAGNQINQAGTGATALNTAQQNEQGILQGANTASNNANVGMQSNINNANAQTAAGNQGMAGKILGGIGSAVSSLSGGLFEKGGMVGEKEHHVKLAEMNAAALNHGRENFADGGQANWAGQYMHSQDGGGPSVESTPSFQQADSGQAYDWSSKPYQSDAEAKAGYAQADRVLGAEGSNPEVMGEADNRGVPVLAAQGGMMENHFHHYFAEGGEVPAMVSPGEVYLSPENVHKVVNEGLDPAKVGERIHGKAKVKGDSLKNDTVPKTLQEGGIVIDRKNMSTREKRELFVHRTLARKRAKG